MVDSLAMNLRMKEWALHFSEICGLEQPNLGDHRGGIEKDKSIDA
jgi:hypothetical protein